MPFGFVLSKGAGKAKGKHDEVKALLNCLHLIVANATTRFSSKVSTSFEHHDCWLNWSLLRTTCQFVFLSDLKSDIYFVMRLESKGIYWSANAWI